MSGIRSSKAEGQVDGEFVSHFFSGIRATVFSNLMSTLDKMRRENDSFAPFDTFFTTPAVQ